VDFLRTLAYVGTAAALCALAVWVGPGTVEQTPELFAEQGEPFFADLADVGLDRIASLEVREWDADLAEEVPFRVEREEGVWTIPSKHGYPADAGDKVGEILAAVADLTRERFHSAQEKDHVECRVVDPGEDLDVGTEGRGRRIVLADAQGKALADVIIGAKVGGDDEEDAGPMGGGEDDPTKRFVRVPGDDRIYAVTWDLDVSTDFSGWIETDLLGLDIASVTTMTVDRYEVDEARGVVLEEDRIVIGRVGPSKWELDDQPEGMQVAAAPITSLTDTLGELTIADVRPFENDARLLAATGFFLGPNRRLLANQGELLVDLEDGIRYKVRFGEIVPGSEEDEEAGLRRYALVDTEVWKKTDGGDSDPEALERAKQLMKRFGGWIYVISAQDFDALHPTRDVLLGLV